MKSVLLILFLILQFSCEHNSNDRTVLGKEYAENELKKALTDSKVGVIENTLNLEKDDAISFSELLLFKVYGKEKILKQRPYEIYKIDKYWILNGTLPTNMHGGTFLIILNSTNGQVIKITHGK